MKIAAYTLDRINRWEVFQLMSDVLRYLEQNFDEMPESFRDKLSDMRTAFDIYDEELVQERRPSAKRLLEADDERMHAISTIYKVLRVYIHYKYSKEKQVAAKGLSKIFKLYGSAQEINRKGQDTKSAMITNLLQDLSEELTQQHIATLNLEDAVSSLEINNISFLKEQRARNNFQAVYVTGVVKNARRAVQKEFMELVSIINALAVVEGQEKYAEMKKMISIIVREYLTTARMRTKKRVVVTLSNTP